VTEHAAPVDPVGVLVLAPLFLVALDSGFVLSARMPSMNTADAWLASQWTIGGQS